MSKTTKKTAAPAAAEKTKSEAVVWCGPTIKGIVRQYTVFSDGLPANVKAVVGKQPLYGALVRPVESFSATKAALRDPNSAESLIYKQIIRLTKRG